MATMQFRISRDEFTRIAVALQRKYVVCEIQGTIDILETDEEKIEGIVDFLREFMINIGNEDVLGIYNCDLIVGGETIQLDAKESERRLKELVKAVMVTWESIKV